MPEAEQEARARPRKSCRIRLVSALASPASLKGRSLGSRGRVRAGPRFPQGRRGGRRAAAGGRGRGNRRGARARTWCVSSKCTTRSGAPREAPIRALAGRHRRRRERRGDPARPGAPRRAGGLEPRARRAARAHRPVPAACWCASAEPPRWTPEQACWRRSTICPAPTTVLCDVAGHAARGAAAVRAAEGRAAPTTSSSSSSASRSSTTRTRSRSCPAAAPRAAWARRSPSLGAQLVAGAPYVLEAIGFREQAAKAELVVTGEGTVDRTSVRRARRPGKRVRVCAELGVPLRPLRRTGRGRHRRHSRSAASLSVRREDLEELGARPRPRVAASPWPGAAARRCARRSRRSGGSPRRSGRST